MFVILVGNPIDGMEIVGPFTDGDEANEYADFFMDGYDWWVVGLKEPLGEGESQ